MIGPILKEAVVLMVFCHIFVIGKDLLEEFQPSPSLPQELNEWLSTVQKHKNDFRLIRQVANKNRKISHLRLEDEYEDDFIKKNNYNQLALEDDAEDQKAELSDEAEPKNDIYPYMYKSNRGYEAGRKLGLNKGSLRHRRASDDVDFIEHKEFVNLEPKGKVGEIRRSDEKYPERYKESFSEEHDGNKMKSNFKEKKETDKDVNKREVEIDIRQDGKLVKQITENETKPKSIILNIEHSQEPMNAAMSDPYPLINANEVAESRSNVPINEAPQSLYTKLPPERSVIGNVDQMKSKEFYSNFNNLFSVNEHLNTDSSIARHAGTVMGPLVYHVTIPNFVPYSELTTTEKSEPRPPHPHYEDPKNVIDPLYLNINGKPDSNPYDFNHNNFQDMSKYWTASEKHQMQKGISFARNNENLRNLIQHIKFPQKIQPQTDNETGFEPAQRIEVDNGKLIKINVAEKMDDNVGAVNYHKRGQSDREGVVEIDNQKPSFLANKPGHNMVDMNRNNVAINSGKANTNAINTGKNIQGRNVKSELMLSLEGPINEGSKNTIPNVVDIVKPENKRQLEFIEGKIQVVNKDKNLIPHALLANPGNKQKFSPNIIEIPIKRDPHLIEDMEPYAQPTVYAQNKDDSLADTFSEANIVVPVQDIDSSKTGNQDLGIDPDAMSRSGYQYVNYDNPKNHEFSNVEIESLDKNNFKQNPESNNKESYEKVYISEEIPRCDNSNSNSEQNPIEFPRKEGNTHIRKLHTHIERDRYVTETDSEMEAPEIESNTMVQERPVHLNQVRGLSRGDSIKRKFRHNRNDGYIDVKRKEHARIYSDKVDPNLKKLVVVYNSPPYVAGRRKNMFGKMVLERDPSIANEEAIDQSDWSKDADVANQKDELSSNLVIRKRGNLDINQALRRKRYRKNHHESSFMGNIVSNADTSKDIVSNENMESSSEYSILPKYVGRQLKTVEYVYDAYDKSGGDDYYEDISTELQETASESEGRVELLQKDSVEGDYGDEEDSVTEKQKKAEFNIVKKTDNEFANPRTTTENEDDYYNEDYDNINYCSTEKPDERPEEKEILVSEDNEVEKSKHPMINKERVLSDSDMPSLHHSRVDNRFKQKMIHRHGSRFFPLNANKIRYEVKGDQVARKGSRKISRNRWNRNKHPSKVYVDKMSDFQKWPTFVIDDEENEEKLRKRSLAVKRKYANAYDFPKAQKDFFINTKRKRKVPDAKVDATSTEKVMPATGNDAAVKKHETVNAVAVTRVHEVTEREIDDTCAAAHQVSVSDACEMDENFNKTEIEVTTLLSIDQPHEGSENDTSHGIYERLDDILDGYFPSKVVSDIFEEIGDNRRLKNRFNKGLSRNDKNLNFQNLNDTNTEETRKILDAMTCLMNRLQLTATCQVLPHNLRAYLKSITRIKKGDSLVHMKEMEEVNFDDTQSQKNFIFESMPEGVVNFQDKSHILKELLDKFNNLPERCRTRGEPVKEYIENHLKMINTVVEDGDSSQIDEPKTIQSRSNSQQKQEDNLVEEQLESLGLGKEHIFIPKFDLDKMIANGRQEKPTTAAAVVKSQGQGRGQGKAHQRNANVNKRDLNSVSRSKKYKKLLDAVRKVKLKRDGERRIAEMFGGSNDYSGLNFNLRNNEANDIANDNFESPLVYSL